MGKARGQICVRMCDAGVADAANKTGSVKAGVDNVQAAANKVGLE